MPLISCPDCEKQVSSNAPTCPNCGAPIAESLQEGKGRFDKAAAAAGLDLSMYATPGTRVNRLSLDAQVAALLSQKKKTSHVLHFLLSLFTGGLWLIVWLLVANSNKRHNRKIDERIRLMLGNVL